MITWGLRWLVARWNFALLGIWAGRMAQIGFCFILSLVLLI
ncbi:MAG: hypothetical protein ACFFAT_20280 [Promethearchaeota archaeon]